MITTIEDTLMDELGHLIQNQGEYLRKYENLKPLGSIFKIRNSTFHLLILYY